MTQLKLMKNAKIFFSVFQKKIFQFFTPNLQNSYQTTKNTKKTKKNGQLLPKKYNYCQKHLLNLKNYSIQEQK